MILKTNYDFLINPCIKNYFKNLIIKYVYVKLHLSRPTLFNRYDCQVQIHLIFLNYQ